MVKRFTLITVLLLGLVACKTEVQDPLGHDSYYAPFFAGYNSKDNKALDDVHQYLQSTDRRVPFARLFSEKYGRADWNNSEVYTTKTGETNVVIPIVDDAKKVVNAFMAISINDEGYRKNIVSKDMKQSLKQTNADGYNFVGATFYKLEKKLYSRRAPEDVPKPIFDKQTEGWMQQCTEWWQWVDYGCGHQEYTYIGETCDVWYEPDPLPPLPPSPTPPEWNDGSTSGSSGSVTDPAKPKNPCDLSKLLKTDAGFKAKMKELYTKAKTKKSESFYQLTRLADGTYSYILTEGAEGTADVVPLLRGTVDGMIHSHYEGLFSIFSFSDIGYLYMAATSSITSNPKGFVFGVVTASGTTYLLAIDNLSAFKVWGQTNLMIDGRRQTYEYIYSDMFKIGKPGYTREQDEANFIKFLENGNMGLKLLKGDVNTFDKWEKRGSNSSGQIVSIGC